MSSDERDPLDDDGAQEGPEVPQSGLVGRLLKRGIESGIGALHKREESVREVIDKLKLPKEMAGMVFDQIDETKNGLYRAVAKEVRDFLESTNFATEAKRILTGLAFEVKMEVRFKDTQLEDGRTSVRPDVNAEVALKDKDKARKK